MSSVFLFHRKKSYGTKRFARSHCGDREGVSMYIDVLFVWNFMMDVLALWAASWFIGVLPGRFRLFAAAFVGALVSCLLAVLVPGLSGGKAVAAGFLLCACMTAIAFVSFPRGRVQGKRRTVALLFLQKILAVYSTAFLVGGLMRQLQSLFPDGQLFFVAGLSVGVCWIGRRVYRLGSQRAQQYCTVTIQIGEACIRAMGLVDTGNQLTIPLTGHPVSVVWEETILEQLSESDKRQYANLRETGQASIEADGRWMLLPYRSVGCSGGVLPVLRADYLCIFQEGKEARLHQQAYLAISQRPLSSRNRYQILLHAGLVQEG